jgi:hypothetical protein
MDRRVKPGDDAGASGNIEEKPIAFGGKRTSTIRQNGLDR